MWLTILSRLPLKGIGVVVAAITIWLCSASYTDNKWEAKWAENELLIQQQHAKQQLALTQHLQSAQARAAELEVEYHDQIKQINTMALDNERLLTVNGGLREKATAIAASASADTGASTCEPSSTAAEPGRLSVETSRALLLMMSEADQVYAYATACYRFLNKAH